MQIKMVLHYYIKQEKCIYIQETMQLNHISLEVLEILGFPGR